MFRDLELLETRSCSQSVGLCLLKHETIPYMLLKPTISSEYGILQCSVQQWKAGSYTLLKDGDVQGLPDRYYLSFISLI